MKTCNNCTYALSKNHTFVMCKLLNKIIDTRKKNNICTKYKSKNMKFKLKKRENRRKK